MPVLQIRSLRPERLRDLLRAYRKGMELELVHRVLIPRLLPLSLPYSLATFGCSERPFTSQRERARLLFH